MATANAQGRWPVTIERPPPAPGIKGSRGAVIVRCGPERGVGGGGGGSISGGGGSGLKVTIDRDTGLMTSLVFHGKEQLAAPAGPNFWR